jgi:CheY-like chemotaxis protein
METAAQVTLRFEVQDTGIGLSEAAKRHLFQPFTQADGSFTRKYGGTGLGLAISKRLVERMGGEIGVESTEDHGSTFWFTLPLERAQDQPQDAVVQARDLRDMRVLVVEDNATHQDIVQHYLAAWGMRSVAVASAEEALAVLRAATADPFAVVVTDLMLPSMDGLELGRTIKADAILAGTPLILMTAFDQQGIAAQALTVGFAGYLTKPVRMSHLLDAIQTAIAGTCGASPQHLITLNDYKGVASLVPAAQARVILVAEDNPVNQKLALLQLRKLGYQAQAVSNGREAVVAVATGAYALVLMDCQMPELDGFGATAAIREAERRGGVQRLPIIAMTANAMQGDRDACLQAGMDDYVAKPVKTDALRTVIEHWLCQTEVTS